MRKRQPDGRLPGSGGSPCSQKSFVTRAPPILGIAASELLFVSSNGWDVAGAKAFGYQVAWCNRTGAPEEELGVRPDLVVGALDKLP